MTEPIGGQGIGVGGQGDVLLGDPGTVAGAASSALPSVADAQQIAQRMIEQLVQARMGSTGGLTSGPAPATPVLPQPPIRATPEGAIPRGPFGSVGERKRADTQAIFNTAGNLINKFQERHYKQKVAKMQQDFETLSGAIRGYQDGQSTGNKQMMEHNARIINSIMSDPKKSKELAKAFDVNLNPMAQGGKGGKQQKPNPANDAMKAAFVKDQQAFQKGETMLGPQAQAMMRQMPQTLQADPRFQMYLEGTKAGLFPKAGEQLTFAKDLMEIQQRIQNNKFTNETRNKIAEMFTAARDRGTMASILRTAMTIQDSKDKMATMEKMWADRSNKLYQGVHERTEAMRDRIKASGSTEDKKLGELIGGLDKTANSLNKQLEDARKAHDVQRMGEISQKLESLNIMQQMANAEIARRLNLNPEDYNQEQFKLDEEMMKNYENLFAGPPESAGTNAADQ